VLLLVVVSVSFLAIFKEDCQFGFYAVEKEYEEGSPQFFRFIDENVCGKC